MKHYADMFSDYLYMHEKTLTNDEYDYLVCILGQAFIDGKIEANWKMIDQMAGVA